MLPVRQSLGGIGNLMFLKAYVMGKAYNREVPDAYVQDYRYWADFRHHIRDYFRQGVGKTIPYIGLHFRRGDYLKAQNFHVNLWDKTRYYQKAIQMFPEGQFLVFCLDRQSPQQDEDDREWCRERMRELVGEEGQGWKMAPIHEDEVEDLNMLASCQNMIGANSTFSFWGAFLGEHKKVVFPKESQWFTDGKTRLKLLPEWTQIEI